MCDWIFYLCCRGTPTGSGSRGNTYTGITKHPLRRLRQHRGEIKGGARWPLTWKGDCDYVLHVTNFPTSTACRSFELYTKKKWRQKWKLDTLLRTWLQTTHNIKLASGIRGGIQFRLYSIYHILSLPKWQDMGLRVEWKKPEYKKYVAFLTTTKVDGKPDPDPVGVPGAVADAVGNDAREVSSSSKTD